MDINFQVLEIELFRVVKEKVGGSLSLSALAEEKVFPVPGDISSDDELGIVNSHLKDQVLREVDIIINSAATTTFDERYIELQQFVLRDSLFLRTTRHCSKL